MPDYRISFRERLSADEDFNTAQGGRIDWGPRLPGSRLPATCMHVTSDPRPVHFTGRQGLRRSRIQMDIFSDVGIDEALLLAEAALALVGVPFVQSGIRFDMPTVDGPETSGNQEERIYVHRARLDILAWHAPV